MTMPSWGALALALALAAPLSACASAHQINRRLAADLEETCQGRCRSAHPDSLYDENRCLEHCEPPEE